MDAPFRLLTPRPATPSDHHLHRMLTTTTPPPTTAFSSFRNYKHTPRMCSAKKRPWDSNAESFRQRKFDFRYGDDDEEEIDDESYKAWIDQGSGFIDKAIDNIFIFKVLKSYGWMLPFIIISMLLVSGPKAFLFTLGVAIGLSLVAYAFQNLFGETRSSPGRRSKREKRSSTATNKSNVYVKPDKATPTSRKESTVSRATRNDDSVGKRVQSKPYGGWDELDEIVDYSSAPLKTPDPVDSKDTVDSTPQPVKMPAQTRVRSELNRMNRRHREMSRTPLLLRLLIAAFPFLSSWIK